MINKEPIKVESVDDDDNLFLFVADLLMRIEKSVQTILRFSG